MNDKPLNGIRVLVTRPAEHAQGFADRLNALGGEAVLSPAVVITPRDPELIRSDLAALSLAQSPLFIFVSAPAVGHGLQTVTEIFGEPGILRTAGVGARTAELLEARGCRNVIRPAQGSGSEALLEALVETELHGHDVIIMRGPGGREKLARELRDRGASVNMISAYERSRPTRHPSEAENLLAGGKLDAVTVTSAEIFENLLAMLSPTARERLRSTALLVPSQRVVTMVGKQGAKGPVILADGADDEAMLAALSAWWQSNIEADFSEEQEMSQDQRPDAEENQQSAAEPEQEITASEDATVDVAESAAQQVVIEKKSGGALAVLALLIAFAAAAGSAYLWWQNRMALEQAPQLESALQRQQSEVRAQIQSLRDELGNVDDQFSDVLSDQQGVALRLQALDELSLRMQSMASEIESMRGVSDSARRSWAVAEAAYFLQAANTSLQLGRNVEAAANALAAADDRLASLGDPSLLVVREKIASEQQALRSIPNTDIAGIALTLGKLAARAGELRTRTDNPEAYATPEQPADGGEDSGLARARRVLGDAMKSMVTVRRTDQQASALLAPEEEFFLARNLELQLLTARLALLKEQPEVFGQSIETSLTWLNEFFDTGSPEVAAAISTLEELRGVAIRRALPDISESLTLLRNMQGESR